MARIRSVHPGWHTDEDVVECGPWARLLEIGLWTHADDQGLFDWKPKTLKMQVFPADDVDVAALLEDLRANNRVRMIERDGKRYGLVRNFCAHQRPRKPSYRLELSPEDRKYVALDAADAEPETEECGTSAEPVPHQYGTAAAVVGMEGSNNCMGASAPHADEPDPEAKPEPKPADEAFDRFWIAYPKRHIPSANPRKPAEKAFAGAIRRGAKPDDLVAAAKRYGAEMKTAGKAGTEFVCQARTWLNEDRWRDTTGPPSGAKTQPGWDLVAPLHATLVRRGDPRGPELLALWERSPPDAVKMANEIRGAA